nr:hypothetical protein [Fibrobacter sp.]
IVKDKEFSDTAVVSIQLTDVAETTPSSNSTASSSSVSPQSSSSNVPVSSSSVSTWVCGDSMLVVNKDRSYKTVLIKDKCWMAENMRKQPSTGKTMCYGEEESNCETYGRLYDHEAAIAVCPSGWHLPKTEDYIAAAEYSLRAGETLDDDAGKHFKPNGGWDGEGGDDLLGFNALPGGHCEYDKECDGIGSGGYWWTSTEIKKDYLYNALYLSVDNDIFNAEAAREYDEYNSVRCIKN